MYRRVPCSRMIWTIVEHPRSGAGRERNGGVTWALSRPRVLSSSPSVFGQHKSGASRNDQGIYEMWAAYGFLAKQKWSWLLWVPFAPFFLHRKHTHLPTVDNPKSWPIPARDSKSRKCLVASSSKLDRSLFDSYEWNCFFPQISPTYSHPKSHSETMTGEPQWTLPLRRRKTRGQRASVIHGTSAELLEDPAGPGKCHQL